MKGRRPVQIARAGGLKRASDCLYASQHKLSESEYGNGGICVGEQYCIVSILYILNTSLLSDTICKDFLLVYGLSFHSPNDVFWIASFFNFGGIKFKNYG